MILNDKRLRYIIQEQDVQNIVKWGMSFKLIESACRGDLHTLVNQLL